MLANSQEITAETHWDISAFRETKRLLRINFNNAIGEIFEQSTDCTGTPRLPVSVRAQNALRGTE